MVVLMVAAASCSSKGLPVSIQWTVLLIWYMQMSLSPPFYRREILRCKVASRDLDLWGGAI